MHGGDRTGIAGFILRGESPKTIIVRAIGPSLRADGQPLPGRLSDPRFELYDKNGLLVAENDDWFRSTDSAAIQQSGLAPEDAREAAILFDIGRGAHTAVIPGSDEEMGIGLVEVYDVNDASNSDLANISTRAQVQTAADILIGGFILQGDTPQRIVLRALGPSLAGRGVPDPLLDRNIELRDDEGNLILSNADWRSSQEAQIVASGLAPSADREAAIIRLLPVGNYTALVRDKGDTTGTALVEAYNVPAHDREALARVFAHDHRGPSPEGHEDQANVER